MEITPITILIILMGVAVGWVLSYIKSIFEIRKYKKRDRGL